MDAVLSLALLGCHAVGVEGLDVLLDLADGEGFVLVKLEYGDSRGLCLTLRHVIVRESLQEYGVGLSVWVSRVYLLE